MSKNTTVTINDYKEFQALIEYQTTYVGLMPVKEGDVIDAKDLKMTMTIGGHPAKKLRPTDQLKAGKTVWEYATKADKVKGTISRYAMLEDLVDRDTLKEYKSLMNDLTKQLVNGEISASKFATAVNDLKEAQAQF